MRRDVENISIWWNGVALKTVLTSYTFNKELEPCDTQYTVIIFMTLKLIWNYDKQK